MKRITTRLLVASLAFTLGVGAAAAWIFLRRPAAAPMAFPGELPSIVRYQPEEDPRRWEPIYFGTIDKHAAAVNLPDLRTVLLAGDDIEVRVWVGFGVFGEDALILRRTGGQWSALHLHGMAERPPFVQSLNPLAAPRSGWGKAWERLENSGILTLPDASAVQCNIRGLDGTHYVVETNVNRTYRTYMYANPNRPKCREARQMMEIGEIIAEEFNLPEFTIPE